MMGEDDQEPPHICALCGDECDCSRDEEGNCQMCSECNGDGDEE